MTVLQFPTQRQTKNTTDAPLLVTIEQAGKLTGYSASTVKRRLNSGDWRGVGTRRGRRVVWSSVIEWIERQAK